MSLTAANRDKLPLILTNPDKYAAIGDLLNDAASGNEVGKPDVSELLVQPTGSRNYWLLKLTGAVTSAGF